MKAIEKKILEHTNITKLEVTQPVKSIYADDPAASTETLEAYQAGNYIIQREIVSFFPADATPTDLVAVYVQDSGDYVGTLETLAFLLRNGITEQVQAIRTEVITGSRIACIGFNPIEQKWYGWSHRAIYGFGIGDKVVRGDCSYTPTSKEDVLQYLKDFWDHGIPRKGGGCNEHMTFTSYVENVRFDVEIDGVLGLMYDKRGDCSDPDGPSASCEDSFEPYPVPWGKGEWTAETLEDAKEMAIAFTKGIS